MTTTCIKEYSTRKIIQISVSESASEDLIPTGTLIALCDDGTLWMKINPWEKENNWEQIDSIP